MKNGSVSTEELKSKDYRSQLDPVWCKGCGDFGVLKSFTNAFSELKLPKEKIAVVTGIGCSSRLSGYFDTYGFNSVHGRALPIATGLKVARPDMTVLVAGGDGDGFSIGGGHIPHAVRRNTDMTYLVMDNQIYGLTKGQSSPTTPIDLKEQRNLGGPQDAPMNPMLMVFSYGAKFLARVHASNVRLMTDILKEAIEYPGFSFIHSISSCVTYIGRDRQDEIRKNSFMLSERGHNPQDYEQAFHVAKNDPYAMGVIYKEQ
jgi:2-oxoglutarate ferredoxin oxidoreductase subunit beta